MFKKQCYPGYYHLKIVSEQLQIAQAFAVYLVNLSNAPVLSNSLHNFVKKKQIENGMVDCSVALKFDAKCFCAFVVHSRSVYISQKQLYVY